MCQAPPGIGPWVQARDTTTARWSGRLDHRGRHELCAAESDVLAGPHAPDHRFVGDSVVGILAEARHPRCPDPDGRRGIVFSHQCPPVVGPLLGQRRGTDPAAAVVRREAEQQEEPTGQPADHVGVAVRD